MNIYKTLSIPLLVILTLSACSSLQESPVPTIPPPDEPVMPTPTAEGVEPPGGGMIVGENALVENLTLNIMESFPVQVGAVVNGSMPDGCTTVQKTSSERVGNTFILTILTQRPANMVCIEMLTPFTETVVLDVAGLPAGTYTVKAYDKTASFTLEVDNVPPEPASCPQPGDDQQLFSRTIEETGADFCFLFPGDFNILGSGAADFFQLIGPQHGEGPEPVSAYLSIATLEAEGRSLEAYVQEKLDEYPEMTFSPEETTLGGQAAVVVDKFPGRLPQRMVFARHRGLIYELAFSPADEATPEAKADLERLYEMVLSSWTFLENFSFECPAESKRPPGA